MSTQDFLFRFFGQDHYLSTTWPISTWMECSPWCSTLKKKWLNESWTFTCIDAALKPILRMLWRKKAVPVWFEMHCTYKNIFGNASAVKWISSTNYSLATTGTPKPSKRMGKWFTNKFLYAARMYLLLEVNSFYFVKEISTDPLTWAFMIDPVPILKQNAGVTLVILNAVKVQFTLIMIIWSDFHTILLITLGN